MAYLADSRTQSTCPVYRSKVTVGGGHCPLNLGGQIWTNSYHGLVARQARWAEKTQEEHMKRSMTQEDAARIQSHADRTGKNQDFKARAQSAAARTKAESVNQSQRPKINQPRDGQGTKK